MPSLRCLSFTFMIFRPSEISSSSLLKFFPSIVHSEGIKRQHYFSESSCLRDGIDDPKCTPHQNIICRRLSSSGSDTSDGKFERFSLHECLNARKLRHVTFKPNLLTFITETVSWSLSWSEEVFLHSRTLFISLIWELSNNTFFVFVISESMSNIVAPRQASMSDASGDQGWKFSGTETSSKSYLYVSLSHFSTLNPAQLCNCHTRHLCFPKRASMLKKENVTGVGSLYFWS